MKAKLSFFLLLFSFVMLTSCIQDEPEYREADIMSFTVDDSLYIESVVKEDRVLLVVNDNVNIEKVAPHFTISPGAIATPASGDTIDFTNDQIYKIRSEDGKYEKSYTVRVVNHGSLLNLKYSFDDWYASTSDINALSDPLWADANSGVKIAALFLGIKKYPTDYTEDCVAGGKAVLLKTIKGGKIIFVGNIPIFAGSLLRGKFLANMDDPLKSLYLGQKYPRGNGKPTYFTGYYKYYPGPTFTDKNGKVVAGKTDQMSMYAAIFKVPKGKAGDDVYLDGHTILTSPDVIARAEWSEGGADIVETPAINDYKYFTIPFVYTDDFDYKNFDYKMTMVFSSSKDGNLYEGAVGSELYVDEVEILVQDF